MFKDMSARKNFLAFFLIIHIEIQEHTFKCVMCHLFHSQNDVIYSSKLNVKALIEMPTVKGIKEIGKRSSMFIFI